MMDLKGVMRSQDWHSERYFDLEQQSYSTNGLPSATIKKPTRSSVMISTIRRGFRMKRLKSSLNSRPWTQTDQPGKESGGSRKKVVDPQGPFLQLWYKIFAVSCIIGVSLDPLFFYIPVIDNNTKCLDLDKKLKIITSVLRSLTDLFSIIHILLQFHTGYMAPSSQVLERDELIEDLWAIAKRYLFSHFIVDIFSALPLPQIVILIIAPRVNAPASLVTRKLLMIAIFSQYVPRIVQISRLYKEVWKDSRIIPDTPWTGAAFNLFLYMLASNVLGAFWYFFTIERVDACWQKSCAKHHCNSDALYCGVPRAGDYSFLNSSCPLLEPNEIKQTTDFNFGIFLEALQSEVVEKQNFWRKLFYCFCWGLRNLSASGQSLTTSNYIGENLFVIFISIIGLVLFALLIGNMQKYLQSMSVRIDEMRVRMQHRKKIEQWMSHRMLPQNLRRRVRRYEQHKWQGTRGVQEDDLIKDLPKDLRRDINRHHCWALLTRVPMFAKMDDRLMDALYDRLKPVLYTENSCIYREGNPIDEMLFLMRGNLLTMTTNGGRTGFFNSVYLGPGDFCGEELLTWALYPNSSSSLPTSTRTVQAVKDVEAFALKADDLRVVASQFRPFHSKRHTFRYYSPQWRTWAASFIQAAWRSHSRKKVEKSLWEEEDRLQGGNSTSLAATIYASKSVANALRRNHPHNAEVSPWLPPLLAQKPTEPDFNAEYLM